MISSLPKSPNLQCALHLVKNGYGAIPVGGGNKGKSPLVPSWEEFIPHRKNGTHGRIPTKNEVCGWWKQHPEAKVALLCGWRSLVVIDIDDRTLADKLAAQFKNHAPLIRTPRGGLHIYCREEEVSKNGPLIAGTVDIKSAGGYVIAPPSKGYTKINNISTPLFIPNARGYATDTLNGLGYTVKDSANEKKTIVASKIEEGGRNSTLASFAGSLKRNNNNITEKALLAAVSAINKAQCDPPLPGSEVATIVRSVMRYPTPTTKWQPIIDFDEYQLPIFPVHTLSPDLREWVEAEAESTQTPVGLAALVALGATATTVQRKIEVSIRSGWNETLSAYILVILSPGNRKSAVFSHGTKPLYQEEKDLRKQMKEEVEHSQSEYRIMEKRVKHAEDNAAKAKDEDFMKKKSIAKNRAYELAKMKPLVYPRFIVDDITPEKIVSLMLEQNERIGLLSADTDAFSIIGGRYDKQGDPNLSVFLKAHVGDTHVVDRMTRPGGILNRPAITMVLTVQPVVLQQVGSVTQFTERGLIARMWFALPTSTVGHRKIKTKAVPQYITDNYERLILNLLHLKENTDKFGKPKAWHIRLSPEAKEVFDYYALTVEPKLASHGDYHNFTNWASKLVGSVARIAGLVHLADHHNKSTPWNIPLSPETVTRAIEIGDYLIQHARAAHGLMKADPEVENAKYLLYWVQQIGPSFTKRDLHRRVRSKLQKINDLDPPLNLLIKHGYLRTRDTNRKTGPGRNPSPVLEVHPDLLKKDGHNGQKPDSDHSDHINKQGLNKG